MTLGNRTCMTCTIGGLRRCSAINLNLAHCKGLPPAAEDDRQGGRDMKKNNQDAPESKPRIVDCLVDIKQRQRVLKSQQQ